MFEELEVVELTRNIKKGSLEKGERGTIVEIYKDGEAYEIEFVTPDGKTKALLTLMPEDIQPTINTAEYADLGNITSLHVTSTLSKVFTTKPVKPVYYSENLKLETKTYKSKESKEEFSYPVATL